MENNEAREHEVRLKARTELIISGVEDVLGFDESALAVKTVMGILNIEGSSLHISRLDVVTFSVVLMVSDLSSESTARL